MYIVLGPKNSFGKEICIAGNTFEIVYWYTNWVRSIQEFSAMIYKMNDGKKPVNAERQKSVWLNCYQGKWSKRKQWQPTEAVPILVFCCHWYVHMGGKGICVNEASQKIAKYSSRVSLI